MYIFILIFLALFTPVRNQVDNMELLEYLECHLPMNLPIAHVSLRKVKKSTFTKLNPNKSPGYDLIAGKILKELKKRMWIGILILLPHRFHKVLSLKEYVAWFWLPHRESFVDTSNFYNLMSR